MVAFTMERWQSKVALVTGASSGIGAAISERLVSHGLIVVGLARRQKNLQELQAKLHGQKGTFYWIKTDLTKEDDINSAFKWVEMKLGRLDILINNAGISDKGLVAAAKTDDWVELINVNVLAVNICTREAIRMIKVSGGEGHIINISSIMASLSTPIPGHATYAGTKRAIEALSDGLRGELLLDKTKIRVSVLRPGVVKTEIFDLAGIQLPPDYPMLNIKDVADAVDFILSLPQTAEVLRCRRSCPGIRVNAKAAMKSSKIASGIAEVTTPLLLNIQKQTSSACFSCKEAADLEPERQQESHFRSLNYVSDPLEKICQMRNLLNITKF